MCREFRRNVMLSTNLSPAVNAAGGGGGAGTLGGKRNLGNLGGGHTFRNLGNLAGVIFRVRGTKIAKISSYLPLPVAHQAGRAPKPSSYKP